VFAPLESTTFLCIFYNGATQVAVKRLIAVLLGLLPVGFLTFYVLHPVLSKMNIGVYVFYLFLELISACAVLIDILLNKSGLSLREQPLLWLVIGMLSFCSLFILYHLLMGYFLDLGTYRYFMLYSSLAIGSMYGGFIACFVGYNRIGKGYIEGK
jgi:hypothetical protein